MPAVKRRQILTGWVIGGALALAAIGVLAAVPIAHGLHPSGALGYGDVVVGVGTLMLALVTLASVVLGWRALADARRGIAISTEALEISRQGLEASRRPVLAPLAWSPIELGYPGHGAIRGPTIAEAALLIPVRNHGSGPALGVQVDLAFPDEHGYEHLDSPHGFGSLEVVGAGETEIVRAWCPLGPEGDLPGFGIVMRYHDLAGKRWATSAYYVASVPPPYFNDLKVDGTAADVLWRRR